MKKWKVGVVLIGITFSSCVTTQVVQLVPKQEHDIPVYVSKMPSRPYTELSYIETSGSVFHTQRKLLEKLKEQAVKENADALVDVKFRYVGIWPCATGIAVKF